MNVGLDIGFGDVKAAYKNGSGLMTLTYPTAISYASTMSNDFLNQFATDEYKYEGNTYLVGDLAKEGAFSTYSFDFLKEFAPLFAFVAVEKIEKATGHKVERLGLGLPLTYFTKRNIGEMKPLVENMTVNGIKRDISASFYVQGYGVLVDYINNYPPEEWGTAVRDLLVVDVGFNTVDIINVEKGKIARKGSVTLDREGVNKIAAELIVALKLKDINLSPVEAIDLLKTGKVKYFNKEIDCTDHVSSATVRYVDWLFRELGVRYDERLRRADKIILAGGGACFLKHFVPAKYVALVIVPETPEMANARGFLRLLEENA